MKFKKTIRSAVSCAAAAALSVSMMSASASAFEPSVITDCEGYSGKLQFTPGERLNDQLGVLLKETDIDLSLNTVEGGKEIISGIDFGGEHLASLNAFYDEETGYIYVQIPELSEDYLYFDPQEMIDEEESEEAEEFLSLGAPIIGGYDLGEIEEAVNSYGEMIVTLLGVGEVSTVTTSVASGTDYTFDTVTYELTYSQLEEFANTLSEASEEDEIICELAEMFAYESPTDMINSFFSVWPEETPDEVEYSNTADEDITEVTLYFLDGKASGISSSYLGMENMVLSVFDEKSVEFFDTTISTFDEDDYFTSVKTFSYYENEDGSASGSLRVISETPEESSGITAQFENVLVDDEQIKGSVVIENTLSELPQTYTIEADINAESQYASIVANEEDELLFSLVFEGAAAEAKPASFSVDMAYNLLDEDEMSLYLKNSNSVQFLAHAEEVLGKDLFDMIMSMIDLPEPEPDDSSSSTPIADSSEIDKNGSDSSSSSAPTTTTSATVTTTAKDPSPETGKALGVGAAMITVLGAAAVIRKRR